MTGWRWCWTRWPSRSTGSALRPRSTSTSSGCTSCSRSGCEWIARPPVGTGASATMGCSSWAKVRTTAPTCRSGSVMLSALDPLGLPLVTQVVAGNAADDPLYLPAINQLSQSLPGHGVLYVGDCKMPALARRADVQAQRAHYLCPLANTQLPGSELVADLQPVWNGERP